MKRMIAIACVLAMISGGALAQHSGAQAPVSPKTHALAKKKKAPTKKTALAKKKKASAKTSKPVEAVAPAQPVPAQVMPPVPATLMNSAPVIPIVTMKDGMLTIDAPNSTLSEVLNGIHNATGAVVEGASPSERVAVRLGPGDPRQVVAALLEGTPYNYVILGSQEKQDAVTRILLTQSSGSSAAPNAPGAGTPPHPGAAQPPENNPPDRTPAEEPAMEMPAEQVEQPPQEQNRPKTPEQMLKEQQPAEQPKP